MASDISKITIKNPRELIEIMFFYDIQHVLFPSNKLLVDLGNKLLRGLTCDDEKTIYLDKNISNDTMRLTVIHEALHCHSYLNSFGLTESQIKKEALKLFEQFYGHRYGCDSFKFEN